MKHTSTVGKSNRAVLILLILGLSTIIFPLYMTIVIAFKQPSEMTNSISGILSLPKTWSLDKFQRGNGSNRFLAFSGKQFADFSAYSGIIHCCSLFNGICTWQKQSAQ